MVLCLFLFIYYSKRYHRNENISKMILLLVPFWFDSKRSHRNLNISGIKLLLVPFGYYSKKCLMMYISIMLLFLYKYFDVVYMFKISRHKFYMKMTENFFFETLWKRRRSLYYTLLTKDIYSGQKTRGYEKRRRTSKRYVQFQTCNIF